MNRGESAYALRGGTQVGDEGSNMRAQGPT